MISKASLAMAVLSQENVSVGSDEQRNFAASGSFSISSSSGRTMGADFVTSRSLSSLEYSPLIRIIFKRFGSLTTDADSRVSVLRSLSSELASRAWFGKFHLVEYISILHLLWSKSRTSLLLNCFFSFAF